MGIEFLGNKKQLESFIMQSIKNSIGDECIQCADIFSGSGSVSAAFKKNGYQVFANDFLYCSYILTSAILQNDKAPYFFNVPIDFKGCEVEDRYAFVLQYLNLLDGKEGFVYKNYSPASINTAGIERMYFTEENAKKIDAIRQKIEEWDRFLLQKEKVLLLSDLLKAVASVSNIAGTYGCYMKYWKKKALDSIELEPSDFVEGKNNFQQYVYNEEANSVIEKLDVDLVYADPPYTKRQYSAYYHILETIALNDNPHLDGSTGLRNWREKASDYCYKRKAPAALDDLIKKANCRYFVLSYNNEGQIPHEKIIEILNKYGELKVYEQQYRRYKSNSSISSRSNVIERIYFLKMEKKNAV